MKKENSQNKKKSKKYNWDYHEKLNQKYETYLFENKDKNDLRLKGNYHYENKPLDYYLSQKKLEPINNSNLTPLPQSKYLYNIKAKEKNIEDYKKYSNIQKSVVEMRRIEYNNANTKKRKKEKKVEKKIEKESNKEVNEIKEEKKEEKNVIDIINNIKQNRILNKNDSMEKIRYSCFQFPYSIKLLDKKRKTMNHKKIIDYILKNYGKVKEEEMPNEVLTYLEKLIPAIIKIQRRYRIHSNNLKKIVKIQVNYKAHLYSTLYKDYYIRREKISKLIYIIQKVLFLNLYHLKVNPNKNFSSKKHFISKNIYNNNYLNKLKFLQKEIKIHILNKHLKIIYGKKKCVYIKPLTIIPLGKIRLLQRNIILFLERLKRRQTKPSSQLFFKKKIHTQKIILIQRFIKAIHKDVIYPPIAKDTFTKNNIFIKSNRKYGHKKTVFIDTKVIPFKPKKIEPKIKNKNSLITKSHKYLEKLILLQKNIKSYLSRDDYDIYDYPKCEEYITKECFVLPKKEKLILLQRQIKYFLYRQKIISKKIKKIVIYPLKITKSIRTNTEKIFMRLSKLRIMYDKNMIFFIVKLIESIKKYLGRISFDKIRKESEKVKIFSVKGGRYKNAFARSKLVKKAVYKVIEPQYILQPLKPIEKKIKSNKNIPMISLPTIPQKDIFQNKEKSKTKRSNRSDYFNNNEKIEKNIEKEK